MGNATLGGVFWKRTWKSEWLYSSRFFRFRIEINEVSPALLRTVVRTKKKNRLKTALIETAWKNVLQNLSGPDRPQTSYQGRVVRSQLPVP